jgi:DNA replication protein DnaC
MATAAAIDRIVHHSVIMEFDLPSYRTNEAHNRHIEQMSDRQK